MQLLGSIPRNPLLRFATDTQTVSITAGGKPQNTMVTKMKKKTKQKKKQY
jgi:hypothetical protein